MKYLVTNWSAKCENEGKNHITYVKKKIKKKSSLYLRKAKDEKNEQTIRYKIYLLHYILQLQKQQIKLNLYFQIKVYERETQPTITTMWWHVVKKLLLLNRRYTRYIERVHLMHTYIHRQHPIWSKKKKKKLFVHWDWMA